MRPSASVAGIKGIFPLIKTLTPQARSPPFSLTALQGLKLAIDATLLVQRLHFADDPHPSRHVIGFHRLITSLRQHGIVPFMVFDHPLKRLALKDREQVKRKQKREIDRIRSRLERERSERLHGLGYYLDALRSLTAAERQRVGSLLRTWQDRGRHDGEAVLSDAMEELFGSRAYAIAFRLFTFWSQFESTLERLGDSQSKGQRTLTDSERQIYISITRQLVATSSTQLQTTGAPIEAEAASDQAPTPSLASLTTMNTTLSKTYNRATSPLSATIYQDCAKLSTLMAVPVFWTGDGTRAGGGRIHEAEAYASSLVRSGFADAVASEDSDVLLYDTVLLRGLMGGIKSPAGAGRDAGRKKLEFVSGKRVRYGLFPRHELESLYNKLKHAGASSTTDRELSDEEYDKMARSMMLDFALLCGTDFNRTVPGIGPKTALRLLKEHGSISAILKQESKKFQPPDGLSIKEYEAELRDARMVFLNPPKVRATARSILGSAAAQDAPSSDHPGQLSKVEHAFYPETAAPQRQDDNQIKVVDVAESSGDPESLVACTAEIATDASDDGSVEGQDSELVIDLSGQDLAVDPSISEVSYDRQAVLEFLRSRDIFRSSLTGIDGSDSTSRSQDWRDLLDLELGLGPIQRPGDATLGSLASARGGDPRASAMGADFFGEGRQADGKGGVACWRPHLEEGVKRETTACAT
ncbi:PIN domain-like protein [Testicularia cyperi]|uniref:PIN domain-like protein n=1 Tax=Testicularia cyperi TaxID=1882483 RepID=A0A317XQ50_9BASI|nr:PIN domain-like protein [Testicularia cyperi]